MENDSSLKNQPINTYQLDLIIPLIENEFKRLREIYYKQEISLDLKNDTMNKMIWIDNIHGAFKKLQRDEYGTLKMFSNAKYADKYLCPEEDFDSYS